MTPAFDANGVQIYLGDCREVLRQLPSESVHTCVTSPPYWGLRDYGTASWEGGDSSCDHRSPTMREGRNEDRAMLSGSAATNSYQLLLASRSGCGKCGATRIDRQIGLEDSPVKYIATMREVFSEVRRVLRSDGTLWLNLGDSYASGGRGSSEHHSEKMGANTANAQALGRKTAPEGLKPKDLVGIPWMLAFALREDGWYLRQDIIWAKPNPMPESVTDRCTKSHEYIFLLSKSERYYYNQDAIKEPSEMSDQSAKRAEYGGYAAGGAKYKQEGKNSRFHQDRDPSHPGDRKVRPDITSGNGERYWPENRNKRSIWSVATQPFPEAHFATFPQELIKPCILAGCPEGGAVLDPFMGSGTTGLVARSLHSKAIGIELNPAYIEIAAKRLQQEVLEFVP